MSQAAASLSAAEPRRIGEDGLAVLVGVGVLILALVSLVGPDLLGWVVTTSVWTDPAKALGAVSKAYADLGGARRAGGDLCRAARRPLRRRGGARRRRQDIRRRLHRRLRHRLCELVRRQLGLYRHRHAGRPGEVRRLVVAAAHQRRRLHRRPDRRPGHRQRLSAFRRLAEGGDPAGALHQDRHRPARRLHRRDRGGQAHARLVAAAARRRGDRRGLSDLLGGGLFHRPQMVRLQPRMGGAARLGRVDLRRRGGDRHRRRDPRPAASAGAGVVAGRRLRRRRSADPAVRSPRRSSPASRWSPPPGSAWRSRPTARRSPPAASPSRWCSPRRRRRESTTSPAG